MNWYLVLPIAVKTYAGAFSDVGFYSCDATNHCGERCFDDTHCSKIAAHSKILSVIYPTPILGPCANSWSPDQPTDASRFELTNLWSSESKLPRVWFSKFDSIRQLEFYQTVEAANSFESTNLIGQFNDRIQSFPSIQIDLYDENSNLQMRSNLCSLSSYN